MGGKTKHVQRTKNNTKPSSSGRSAELLASSNIPSSVGFANVTEFGFLPTMLQNFSMTADTGAAFDDMDSAIDTEYQLVFRKMMKKDPITKVKALQEFNELVMGSEVATVKSILKFWPRLYNNLSTDVEHRVREAAQNAQFALVNKVGKLMAEILKQIAPAWITSQYDTYAPAASVATASFQKAFPPNKLQDVFNFCQNEILDYLTKNLTFFTATTLSNPQSNSPEECEAKYQRVLICSLKGYAMYLSRSSAEHLLEASNKNTALVEHSKFWSYQKHKNPSIRAAWFEALSAILQFAPELLANVEKQAATSAMQSVDETESVVLPHAWTSVLLVTQKISNWQTYVNMEKALLPKLWKMLKNGGGGNAETIYPHLLPLLSKLDRTVLGDKTIPFYLNFFENINIGLTTRVVHSASSRADITAIATAYFECIQFVFIQLHRCPSELFDAAEVQLGELCERIFRTHLIGTIEFFLTNENAMNGKHVLGRLALLVRSWTDNCKDIEVYQDLLKLFWTEVFATIEKSFTTAKGERQTTANLELIFEFVQQLGSQSPTNKTKTAKVKFAAVEDAGGTDEVDSVTKTDEEANAKEKCTEPLQELAVSVCRLYMKKVTETTDPVFIVHLEKLLKLYRTEPFFGKLVGGSSNDIAKLYDKFASWLLVPQLRSENTVDIILMLYPYLDATEKTKLLTKLIKFPNETVQYWTLSRILSHPLCTSADILRLLSHSTVHEMLLKTAKNVVAGKNVTDSVNLLHKCFFQTENGDILIDCLTSAGIVEILSQSLTDTTADEHILDTCASFLAQIMPVICSDPNKKELQIKMFVRLFRLSVNREISAHLISEDTLWEVVTSWQDALSSKDIELDDNLIGICSDIVQDGLDQFTQNDRSALADIESLAEIVSKLILCSIECCESEAKTGQATKIIDNLFGKCEKAYRSIVNDVQHACTFIELISDRFGASKLGDEASITEGEIGERIRSMIHLTIYKFETIFKITCNVKKCQQADVATEPAASTDDEHTEDYCDLDETLLKQWPDRLYDDALDAIYAATLCNTLVDNSLLQHDIEDLAIHLQERVNLFLKNISTSNAIVVKDRLFAKVNSSDPFWALSTLALLNTDPYCDAITGLPLLHNDLTLSINRTNHLSSYLNVLQSFTPKLPHRQLPIGKNILSSDPDLHYSYRCIALRCLLSNYFQTDFNETTDHSIVQECTNLIEEMYQRTQIDKTVLLYNDNLASHDAVEIVQIAEIINFLTDILKIFPKNITETGWDFVRIAISSWVLSLSKSSDSWQNPKIAVFIASVYKMFDALSAFIRDERIRSSIKSLTDVIDEWENVFAKDVNLILLKCFMKFVQGSGTGHDDCREKYLLKTLSACVNSIDFKHLRSADKIDSKTSVDDLIEFALTNLSHTHHPVRMACYTIIRRMSPYLIDKDAQATSDGDATSERHFLHKFQRVLESQSEWPLQYIEEFNFKTTECDGFSEIPNEKSIPFLLLWDCVLYVCDHAPSELRSTYAAFIVEHKFEQLMLNLLFRLMPIEVLKNQDSKATGSVYFAPLTHSNIADDAISAERYACCVYMLALKHLPAVVRKWWTDSHPRQKLLVDKITSVFVSSQLCNDELRALLDKKKKNDSFQITVHNSTREARATYVIDEARMELIIQLPVNYPLGTVKVSCGQQIGDKLQSRVVVMQLSIFLTHQNGSIWDGLSLWKRNLDRKFEGVEECYVCYSVIHQETCQLPKLTCKTCKKRFHGQCLYKWFSTSNKSTCPICRNIF